MPEGAIYVGRPSPWGNPFPIGRGPGRYTAEGSLRLFRMYADDSRRGFDWIEPLRGHDLACFCPLDQPCHGDVLLELANR
jgi:Domain of unknown function (DUF4326)